MGLCSLDGPVAPSCLVSPCSLELPPVATPRPPGRGPRTRWLGSPRVTGEGQTAHAPSPASQAAGLPLWPAVLCTSGHTRSSRDTWHLAGLFPEFQGSGAGRVFIPLPALTDLVALGKLQPSR